MSGGLTYYFITLWWPIFWLLWLLPVLFLDRWVHSGYKKSQLRAAILAASLGWPFALGMILARLFC